MPVIIKRYRNRKLYNTKTKRYITLDEIEDLIKEKQIIKVIENQTGKDITALTISQIILEVEKNNSGFLPIKILLSLVQSGGKRIDEMRQNIFNSLNLYHHYDVEIERRINKLIENGELTEGNGNDILDKLLRINSSIDESGTEQVGSFVKSNQVISYPSRDDFQLLIQQVDDMSRRMDEYTISHNHNIID